VLSTDIVFAASLDMCLDAQAFPLKDGSVRAVFAQNAFHHLPNPRLFFSELQRILVPGGGAVLIEPHFGPLASVIYPRLFKSEGFDKAFPEWEVPAAGPMNGANQALSYIVFVRDLQTFAAEFPLLEVVHRGALTNGPRYVLSGGLNFRQLVPQVFSPVVKAIEGLLWPLREVIGLHQMIVIRRRSI
jgi:SAM-dependent methyltransferase